ncbi:MAG: hypothetical protein L6Q98_11330 [Anaerolineae bacterium]|nr:hypothetical protein [Anaerolineae bacterium]NUQ05544.1 hypothetical protein [Anaerolineae bacterium]
MQTARAAPSASSFNLALIALPLAALLGFGAAVALFAMIGALPLPAAATSIPTAAPIAMMPTAQPTLIDTPIQALKCRVTNPADTDLLVRSAPDEGFAPLGMLSARAGVQALGRTTTQPVWFAVGFAERRGWIAESAGLLAGDCQALPAIRNPLVPDAPADPPAHVIAIDRDGAGTFRESISTPGGDPEDLVWVRVINLYTAPPNNFREFTLSLECAGTGGEALRWGIVGSPLLRCGDSMTFPFIYGASDRPLTIQFPPGSPQAFVTFALRVALAAQPT